MHFFRILKTYRLRYVLRYTGLRSTFLEEARGTALGVEPRGVVFASDGSSKEQLALVESFRTQGRQ